MYYVIINGERGKKVFLITQFARNNVQKFVKTAIDWLFL